MVVFTSIVLGIFAVSILSVIMGGDVGSLLLLYWVLFGVFAGGSWYFYQKKKKAEEEGDDLGKAALHKQAVIALCIIGAFVIVMTIAYPLSTSSTNDSPDRSDDPNQKYLDFYEWKVKQDREKP